MFSRDGKSVLLLIPQNKQFLLVFNMFRVCMISIQHNRIDNKKGSFLFHKDVST